MRLGQTKRGGQLERIERRFQVAERYLRGETQEKIARELGLASSQVRRLLKDVRDAWLARQMEAMSTLKAEELAKIDNLERVYFDAWEVSRRIREDTTTEQVTVGDGQKQGAGRRKAKIRKVDRDGNPAFLQGVQWCISERCKILGLYAPQKVDIEQDIRVWARQEGFDEDLAIREVERWVAEDRKALPSGR